MIEFLLARALARLPEPLRARYEAEWRADLATLDRHRPATVRWAIGLQRASSELRGVKRRTWLPRLALDAVALGLAYYAAYLLRFDNDVPGRYQDLLVQTLPFAILGGLMCMALTGNYGATNVGPLRIAKGVALATVTLVAYTAVVQPTLVVSEYGLRGLNVPAGVIVLFAMTATVAMLLNRAVLHWTRIDPIIVASSDAK